MELSKTFLATMLCTLSVGSIMPVVELPSTHPTSAGNVHQNQNATNVQQQIEAWSAQIQAVSVLQSETDDKIKLLMAGQKDRREDENASMARAFHFLGCMLGASAFLCHYMVSYIACAEISCALLKEMPTGIAGAGALLFFRWAYLQQQEVAMQRRQNRQA